MIKSYKEFLYEYEIWINIAIEDKLPSWKVAKEIVKYETNTIPVPLLLDWYRMDLNRLEYVNKYMKTYKTEGDTIVDLLRGGQRECLLPLYEEYVNRYKKEKGG